jgi:hypothetical protein
MSTLSRFSLVALTFGIITNAASAESPTLGRVATSEELGAWDVSIGPDGAKLPPTVNLHDWYIGYRNNRVEALWPIAARGAFF